MFFFPALLAFGRLCSGDVYDVCTLTTDSFNFMVLIDGPFIMCSISIHFQIHIKHGSNFKWKSRCKVERDGQKWTDSEVIA